MPPATAQGLRATAATASAVMQRQLPGLRRRPVHLAPGRPGRRWLRGRQRPAPRRAGGRLLTRWRPGRRALGPGTHRTIFRWLAHRLIFRADAQVIERDGYCLVVRTPHNPTFYWGNFLLFDRRRATAMRPLAGRASSMRSRASSRCRRTWRSASTRRRPTCVGCATDHRRRHAVAAGVDAEPPAFELQPATSAPACKA